MASVVIEIFMVDIIRSKTTENWKRKRTNQKRKIKQRRKIKQKSRTKQRRRIKQRKKRPEKDGIGQKGAKRPIEVGKMGWPGLEFKRPGEIVPKEAA